MINESQGVVEGRLYELAKYLYKRCYDAINKWRYNKYGEINFTIPNAQWKKYCDYPLANDKLKIKIGCYRGNKAASYRKSFSGQPIITINERIFLDNINENEFISLMMHELTHLVNDVSNSPNYREFRNFRKIDTYKTHMGKPEDLAYLFDKTEMNARLTESFYELIGYKEYYLRGYEKGIKNFGENEAKHYLKYDIIKSIKHTTRYNEMLEFVKIVGREDYSWFKQELPLSIQGIFDRLEGGCGITAKMSFNKKNPSENMNFKNFYKWKLDIQWYLQNECEKYLKRIHKVAYKFINDFILNQKSQQQLSQVAESITRRVMSLLEHDNHYTQYSDIEKELVEYAPYLEGKTIMLCCDKPYISEFWNFFQNNLKNLDIPMVVSTFWSNDNNFPPKMTILTKNGVSEKPLKGNGDFLSDEIRNIMSYIDVVVTNPPFSNGMFSKFLQQLKELGKKFIVIGPTTSAYDGKVFKMFKNDEISMGHNYDMKFSDQLDGGKLRRKQTSWFTNLETPEKGDFPQNNADISKYDKYDNFDAINVNYVKDIPTNYDGMIGVPPSVINMIDLNLYDLINSKRNLTINGRRVPRRYIIKRKPQQLNNVAESLSYNVYDVLMERLFNS